MTWVLVGVPLVAPGIPRSRRFAGSRPLTLREGGVWCWVWFVVSGFRGNDGGFGAEMMGVSQE